MIGTSFEMLQYHTFRVDAREKLGFSVAQMKKLRIALGMKHVGESAMEEYLTRLGCRKIRDKIVIPYLYEDGYRRIYTEDSMLSLAEKSGVDGIEWQGVHLNMGYNRPQNEDVLDRAKKALGFRIHSKRLTLPSIWVFEEDGEELKWKDSVHKPLIGRLVRFD